MNIDTSIEDTLHLIRLSLIKLQAAQAELVELQGRISDSKLTAYSEAGSQSVAVNPQYD